MNRSGLEDAIAQTLRADANGTPDCSAVQERILHAAAGLDTSASRRRRTQTWFLPALAAAAIVLITAGVVAVPKLLSSDHAGPRPANPGVTGTQPVPSPTDTKTGPSTPPAPHRPVVAADWFKKIDPLTVARPSLGCPGLHPELESNHQGSLLAAGEAGPLWVITIRCAVHASWADQVEIYRYSPGGPQRIQTVTEPRVPSMHVLNLTTVANRIELTELGYAPNDPSCCATLRFTQQLNWDAGAHRFAASAPLDALLACTGDQLTVTTTPLSSQSGDSAGVLLNYVNTSDAICTMTGYPGASAADASGRVLVDAARTPKGFFGGLATPTSVPTRVTLIQRGGEASAVIEWSAAAYGASARCVPATQLLSTPPDTTATRSVGPSTLSQVCSLEVHPVVAGPTGKST